MPKASRVKLKAEERHLEPVASKRQSTLSIGIHILTACFTQLVSSGPVHGMSSLSTTILTSDDGDLHITYGLSG